MDADTSRRLLWAAMGGVIVAGLLRAILPDTLGVGRAVSAAAAFIVVSLVAYRALSGHWRSG